jgi:UPF0755 protein
VSRRAAIRVGVAAAAALALAATLGMRQAWRLLDKPWPEGAGEAVVVEIPRHADARGVVARLAAAGVLRHPRLVLAWLAWTGDDRALQAGEYRFDRSASAFDVLDRVVRGDVVLHVVTVPEGLRLDEIAARFEAAGFGPARAFAAAFADPAPIRDLDPRATDLEGYLFPDTYAFPRSETPLGAARAMVRRFRQVTHPWLVERAGAAGLDLRRAVVLASLVEEETGVAAERSRVARVFHNRLARGMRLQCDPTVLFALRRAGQAPPRLLRVHLGFDSPWNTYRVAGLPPGPICSPGLASLRAAVDPAPGRDLYFVAAPAGGHVFSADLASHERAVRQWRRYARSSR